MNLKEMDIKGKARLRINTLITKMGGNESEAILKYSEEVYEIFKFVEEEKSHTIKDIKSEIESYEVKG